MICYLLYDYEHECFVGNIACGDRKTADKWCTFLEESRGLEVGTFAPIKFVNGEQVGII